MLDQLTSVIPIVHAGATWFMTGLIWFVQIVHYPLMREVQSESFSAYAHIHQQRTTWVVAPTMLVEAIFATLLLFVPPTEGVAEALPWIGSALLAFNWLVTFAVLVPLHARLSRGFADDAWRRLVALNWLRTIAWSARGLIALALLK